MKEHLVIQPQIKQKTEILKTWSNLFNTEDIKKLCNNLHITPEKLSDFLQVMRDQNGKLPESDRERINFLSFIVAYCNPKNNYLVYDDDNNECVDK